MAHIATQGASLESALHTPKQADRTRTRVKETARVTARSRFIETPELIIPPPTIFQLLVYADKATNHPSDQPRPKVYSLDGFGSAGLLVTKTCYKIRTTINHNRTIPYHVMVL